MSDIIKVEEWVRETVKPIVVKVLDVLDAEEEKFGTDMALYLVEGIMQALIASLVRKTLVDDYSDFEDERKAMYHAFGSLQAAVQSGVSGGLSVGVQSATGEVLEYWCAVKLVGATINSKPS